MRIRFRIKEYLLIGNIRQGCSVRQAGNIYLEFGIKKRETIECNSE